MHLLPYLALTTSAIIWAIAAPVIVLTLEHIGVFTFLFYRFLLVGVLMLPIILLELKRSPIHPHDLPKIIVLGIASQVSIVFIFLGLNLTTALDSAIIGVIAPLLTIAAGHYFYNEKLSRIARFGILIATIGTLLTIIEPVLSNGDSGINVAKRILGNIFILIYQFSWPVYIILGKRLGGQDSARLKEAFKFAHISKLKKSYSPTLLTGISFYVALFVFMFLAIFEQSKATTPLDLNNTVVGGIVYMAVFSSIVAYIFYQWGLKYLEATETAIFAYLASIFTIPAAYLILGEIPTQTMLVGGAITALGVIIAEKYKS